MVHRLFFFSSHPLQHPDKISPVIIHVPYKTFLQLFAALLHGNIRTEGGRVAVQKMLLFTLISSATITDQTF